MLKSHLLGVKGMLDTLLTADRCDMARFAAGLWKLENTHRHFCRWRDRDVWEDLLESLIIEPDYQWLMSDASHCKVHLHAAGAVGGNQGMSRTK